MLVPTCMVKTLEFSLALACVVLHHYSFDLTDLSTLMLCSGTYIGFVIILSGEIIGELIFSPLDLIQDMYFTLLGMVLYSTCGCLILTRRLYNPPLYTVPYTDNSSAAALTGWLSLGTAGMMFLDLSMAYLDSEEFEETPSV